MKRDLELIRAILLEVEQKLTSRAQLIDVPGYPPDLIAYNVELLVDGGYMQSASMASAHLPTRLTWKGHEFLDATRSESVWQQVRAQLKDRRVDAPIALIQELAIKIAASMLGLRE